jgi:uncharacterized protein (DUF2141 family)
MKKRKYLLLTLILSLLWINDVNAECSKEIKETFEQVKDKYKIDYVLDKTTKTYTLTLYYDDSLHYIYDFGEEMEERQSINSTDKSLTFGGIKPGKYEINVIVNPTICDEQLKTIKLNLPKYNIYYDDPLCKGNEEIYLSSADWMPRNLDRRVEILFPILSDSIFARLKSVLINYLDDTENSSILDKNGKWTQISQLEEKSKSVKKFSAQKYFHEKAQKLQKIQKDNFPSEFIVRR